MKCWIKAKKIFWNTIIKLAIEFVISIILFGCVVPVTPANTAQQRGCYPGLDCPDDLPNPNRRVGPVNPPPRTKGKIPKPSPPVDEPEESSPQIPSMPSIPPRVYVQPRPKVMFCCMPAIGRKFGPALDYGNPGDFCYVNTPVGPVPGYKCF